MLSGYVRVNYMHDHILKAITANIFAKHMGPRGTRSHSNLGGPQRLKRIDSYGEIIKSGGNGPCGSPGWHAYAYGSYNYVNSTREVQN